MFDLSIITINYNNASGLKQTVDSVVNQSNKNFEYIIIDGNSTDKSKRIIDSLEFENLKWISEEDSGIYNAMNKGLRYATGDVIAFLNADDFYYNNKVIEDVNSYFTKDIQIVYGNIKYYNNKGCHCTNHNCINKWLK